MIIKKNEDTFFMTRRKYPPDIYTFLFGQVHPGNEKKRIPGSSPIMASFYYPIAYSYYQATGQQIQSANNKIKITAI